MALLKSSLVKIKSPLASTAIPLLLARSPKEPFSSPIVVPPLSKERVISSPITWRKFELVEKANEPMILISSRSILALPDKTIAPTSTLSDDRFTPVLLPLPNPRFISITKLLDSKLISERFEKELDPILPSATIQLLSSLSSTLSNRVNPIVRFESSKPISELSTSKPNLANDSVVVILQTFVSTELPSLRPIVLLFSYSNIKSPEILIEAERVSEPEKVTESRGAEEPF